MLFSSLNFICIFLPIVLFIYFLNYKINKNKKISIVILLVSSIIFYGYNNLNHLYIFIFSILINFLIGNNLSNLKEDKTKLANNLLCLGIIFNLSLLFLYKYFNFFINNLSYLGLNLPKSELILPIGISFYTFQQIGYLIDSRNKKTNKTNIFEYASFVTFFPQLIAGPIVHHSHFINQIRDIKFKVYNDRFISNGILIFIIGLFKKIIIADTISRKAVIPFYNNISNGDIASAISAWISTAFYSLQIYFDFSAYSEMAIGIGLLFGITLPINFNSPFQAKSLIDYWNRWNITLSNFISEYVYLPIFKKLSYKSYNLFNNHIYAIVIAMTISGFWHGANWNFIFWGFIHGVALAINHLSKSNKININLHPFISRIIFLGFINISFIFFKTADLKSLKIVLLSLIPFKNLFNNFGLNISSVSIDISQIAILLVLMMIVLFLPSSLSIIGYKYSDTKKIEVDSFFKKFNFNNVQIFFTSLLTTLLFAFSITQINQSQEFIYFQF